jgi:hypothetical protein
MDSAKVAKCQAPNREDLLRMPHPCKSDERASFLGNTSIMSLLAIYAYGYMAYPFHSRIFISHTTIRDESEIVFPEHKAWQANDVVTTQVRPHRRPHTHIHQRCEIVRVSSVTRCQNPSSFNTSTREDLLKVGSILSNSEKCQMRTSCHFIIIEQSVRKT